jgi:hypothetical protein
MRIFMLLLLAQAPPAAAPRNEEAVALTLSDGSTLRCSGVDDVLQVRTAYGDQRIPIREIRVARRLPHGSFVIQTRGVSLTGDVVSKEIDVSTAIGPFRVATEDIRSLHASCGGKNLVDESTTALWWFAETDGGTCRDRVKGRPFALQDFARSEDAAGAACILRGKFNGVLSAECDEDLDIMDEEYTLEVRFRLAPQIARPVMILQKGNPQDGSQDFHLSCQNYALQMYCITNGQSAGTPAAVLRRDGWNTVTIVQKKDGPQTLLYVNGKQVLNLAVQYPFGGGQRRPIHLGVNPRMAPGYEAPEAFQCLRISKTARTPEEILAMERGWEFSAAAPPVTRGAVLRDGSSLRADFPGLSGAVFRTRFGPLTLTDKTSAQIRLFPFRPKELEVVRTQARELIAQLGGGRAQDREAASGKLLALGEAAVPVLRESESARDEETRGRIASVLKKMAETGVLRRPACDVLQLGDIVLHGWLEMDQIVLSTRRGTHRLSSSQVELIMLGRKESRGRPMLQLQSGEALEFNPAEGAKADLETAFGSISVPLDDLRTLSFDADKKRWSLSADRLSAVGRISGAAVLETPLGPLTVPLSEARELRTPGKSPAPAGPAENE